MRKEIILSSIRQTKNPDISVIMSVYNGMPYVIESVKSILEQTYKNFEFIIINDASEDTTNSFLRSIKDKRVRIITNRKNLGLARSLNIALKNARGKFIARMDADDISLSSRLESQINFMKKNPRIDLCGTFATLINDNNSETGKLVYPTSPEDIKRKLVLFNPIIHPTFFAKRIFYGRLKGYDNSFDGAEDYELLIRGLKIFNYANLPRKLLMLRLSQNRRSQRNMHEMDLLDLKIKLKVIKEDGPSLINLYAVVKKMFITYLIPPKLKIRIARLMKIA